MKIDFSRGKTAIFIGSSVCEGCGATNNRGWTAMTAERMERNGCDHRQLCHRRADYRRHPAAPGARCDRA